VHQERSRLVITLVISTLLTLPTQTYLLKKGRGKNGKKKGAYEEKGRGKGVFLDDCGTLSRRLSSLFRVSLRGGGGKEKGRGKVGRKKGEKGRPSCCARLRFATFGDLSGSLHNKTNGSRGEERRAKKKKRKGERKKTGEKGDRPAAETPCFRRLLLARQSRLQGAVDKGRGKL